MPWLPKPYPDEVIGSVIARGCRQTGLPMKRLLREVTGTPRSYVSFLMSGDCTALGAWCGVDPEALLLEHTVFPYTVAFMPKATRSALMSKALRPIPREDCLGSLTKNVSHGLPFLRLCRACIKEDLYQYGETYWRRSHQLPVALLCSRHGLPLQLSDIAGRGRRQFSEVALPDEVTGRPLAIAGKLATWTLLTSLSVRVLSTLHVDRDEECLAVTYRTKALDLGFVLPSGAVAGIPLAYGILGHFGRALLDNAGCDIVPANRSPWPALMVRPAVGVPFIPSKHVLMQTFLAEASVTSTPLTNHYANPGKKTRDYERLDVWSTAKVKAFMARAAAKRERYTVQAMLTEIGIWSSFRHERERFPRTNALIQAFRASDQSERQLGKRLCWRERGTKRAKLRALREATEAVPANDAER